METSWLCRFFWHGDGHRDGEANSHFCRLYECIWM